MADLSKNEEVAAKFTCRRHIGVVIESERHKLDEENKKHLQGIQPQDIKIIGEYTDDINHVSVNGKEYRVNITPTMETLTRYQEETETPGENNLSGTRLVGAVT